LILQKNSNRSGEKVEEGKEKEGISLKKPIRLLRRSG
jgi:hypothetical protein